MKKGNAFRLLILIVGLAVVVTSISVSIAYMLKSSDEITDTFIPAKVTCQMVETVSETTIGGKNVPIKTSVKAQNTGNIEAYIRVRVVTYWEDSKGNPVARTSPENKFGGDWKYNQTDWIYDAATQTFYHKSPIDVGQTTNELLNIGGGFNGIELEVVEVLQGTGSVSFTYHAVVEFIVEGIQAAPGEAVTSSWEVTLDDDGNITAKN